jgi:release factor glutamine methyltransferase
MIAADALRWGTRQLVEVGIQNGAVDARWLLAEALEIPRDRLTVSLRDPLTAEARARFETLIKARQARRPVSHLLGRREFYGHSFTVTPDVLDPRPETEHLVEAALSVPFQTVLDLGTGSGCILLSLLVERPEATGVGVDLSQAALAIAAQNRDRLGLNDRAHLMPSDWFQNVSGRFDLIVSNPPYIAEEDMAQLAPEVRLWEPKLALTPGGDGLGAYRRIAASAPDYLPPGGHVIVEIGASQASDVCEILQDAGFAEIRVSQDLSTLDRVVQAHWPN